MHLPRDPFATVMCKVSYFERGPTAYAYEAGGREGGRPPVSNISEKSLFSGQTQVAQKSWMIKNTYSIEWIQGKLCFQGKRKMLKNPEW